MARFICVDCDHEDHFTAFRDAGADGADIDGDDDDADEALACPECGSTSVYEP
jgi:DNA-directed RNA polymerase subunit RPC12/RpoP